MKKLALTPLILGVLLIAPSQTFASSVESFPTGDFINSIMAMVLAISLLLVFVLLGLRHPDVQMKITGKKRRLKVNPSTKEDAVDDGKKVDIVEEIGEALQELDEEAPNKQN